MERRRAWMGFGRVLLCGWGRGGNMSVRRQRSGRVGADHARRALSCAVALVDGFEGGQAAHWRRWVASASYLRGGGEWRRTDDELLSSVCRGKRGGTKPKSRVHGMLSNLPMCTTKGRKDQ